MSSFLDSLVSSLTSSNSTQNQAPKVYLQNAGSKIQFPIPPSSFEVNIKQNNTIVNINSLGELNMLGKTGLLTLSLSSFFPNQEYSFCQCTPDSPYNYVKTIDTWRTNGKPSRITISDTPINYAVTIDNFKFSEKDGTGDVYFSLDFKEYKFVGGALDNTVNSVTGLKDRTDTSSLLDTVKNITVYSGDSLMDVASRTLGQNVSVNTGTKSYLSLYAALVKRGGVTAGDVLKVTKNNTIKVGGSNVQL